MKYRNFSLLYFLISISVIFFLYGVIVGKFHIFPYKYLNEVFDGIKTYTKNGIVKKSEKYPVWVYPSSYKKNGVHKYNKNKSKSGLILMSGYWHTDNEWFIGLRLIKSNGDVIHEWKVKPGEIWDTYPYTDYGSKWDKKRKKFIQGFALLPNGEVVLNVEYLGLLKLNKYSEVIWKLNYRTHHAVFPDKQGNYWVCGRKWKTQPDDEFPGLKPPYVEETILKVNDDGEIKREISILDVIYESDYKGLLFMDKKTKTGDITHLNDVEVLKEIQSKNYKQFSERDIIVSLRNINTIIVIDNKTEQIKWSMTHPFVRQHDPDFTNRGYITVFDNQDDGTRHGEVFGGSRILEIDPQTDSVDNIYPNDNKTKFYTKTSGKHQHLDNGNILITESESGRVFEITQEGEIVWSYIGNKVNEEYIPEILGAKKYAPSYLRAEISK